MFRVVEKFVSINGEGRWSGEVALFIRFAKCNLDCSYCDTRWANEKDVVYETMSKEEIKNYILNSGIERVTLTGGEPLLVEGIIELLKDLALLDNIFVEIETNGSVDIKPFMFGENISFTVDYKGRSSNMERKMYLKNYENIRKIDTVKFVLGTYDDMEKAKGVVEKFDLINRTKVYFSSSYEELSPAEIVEFMTENRLNKIKLQLQMHKYIWDPNKKGV